MKMLKIGTKTVLAVFFIVGLVGCADFDNDRCLQTVQNEYMDAIEIKAAPYKKYYFFVNTGAEIRLVTTKGSWDEITTDTLFMRIAD